MGTDLAFKTSGTELINSPAEYTVPKGPPPPPLSLARHEKKRNPKTMQNKKKMTHKAADKIRTIQYN